MEASVVKEAAKGKWYGIMSNLGITVPEDPKKHAPCPSCGGKDRFRFDDQGSGMYYCNGCGAGDGFSLVQKTLGLTFPETLERINEIVGTVEFKMPQGDQHSEANIKKWLNELWTSSTPLTGSDPASKYLHSRGLSLTPKDVRFCPACWEKETKTKMHAMVARVTGPDGKPVTIHRTYLQDGKKAEIESPKKLMPHTGTMAGSAVRLFSHKEVLGVAEGIETAIAATQIFDIPTWACISSTGLESFKPPEEARKIVIFGDNDFTFTGQKAAFRLAHELHINHDRIVDVQIPEAPGTDWADVCKVR